MANVDPIMGGNIGRGRIYEDDGYCSAAAVYDYGYQSTLHEILLNAFDGHRSSMEEFIERNRSISWDRDDEWN